MKITKARLKQIIREELQVTLTNEEAGEMFGEEVQEELEKQDEQLDESIDVAAVERLEDALKQIASKGDIRRIYNFLLDAHGPVVGTPQTKADTGEAVTDETAHRDAKEFIIDTLAKHIDDFQEKAPEMNEQ